MRHTPVSYTHLIEFINEGCDINTLKVADITGRAGIGKGTAYEYFSSKEEIISSAILYYVKVCFEKLQVISTDNRTFQQKINEVMDFIDEHVKEKQGVFFLIKMVLESYEIPKNLKDEYERMKHQCCDKEKNEIIDCIVEEGDVYKRQVSNRSDCQMWQISNTLTIPEIPIPK